VPSAIVLLNYTNIITGGGEGGRAKEKGEPLSPPHEAAKKFVKKKKKKFDTLLN
jgi:hypothetical protein